MNLIKRITISLPVDVYEKISHSASKEHRSPTNWVEHQVITRAHRPPCDVPENDLCIRFAGSQLNPGDMAIVEPDPIVSMEFRDGRWQLEGDGG